MQFPNIMTPDGLFEYLIGLILLLAVVMGLFIYAVSTGLVTTV